MNIDIGAKRDKKRLKRLRTIAGRLTAFGQKTYPDHVLRQMRRTERLQNRMADPEPAAAQPQVWEPPRERAGFFKSLSGIPSRLFFRNKGGV